MAPDFALEHGIVQGSPSYDGVLGLIMRKVFKNKAFELGPEWCRSICHRVNVLWVYCIGILRRVFVLPEDL